MLRRRRQNADVIILKLESLQNRTRRTRHQRCGCGPSDGRLQPTQVESATQQAADPRRQLSSHLTNLGHSSDGATRRVDPGTPPLAIRPRPCRFRGSAARSNSAPRVPLFTGEHTHRTPRRPPQIRETDTPGFPPNHPLPVAAVTNSFLSGQPAPDGLTRRRQPCCPPHTITTLYLQRAYDHTLTTFQYKRPFVSVKRKPGATGPNAGLTQEVRPAARWVSPSQSPKLTGCLSRCSNVPGPHAIRVE